MVHNADQLIAETVQAAEQLLGIAANLRGDAELS
jgi:hypothetical protein